MYPKVKVRSFEEDDDEFEWPASPLKGSNSLTNTDSSPPVKGSRHKASSVSVARAPKLDVPRSITPPHALPKDQKKSEPESDDTSKKHIRASSMPRPRAVVSSPDNDQLLGSKSRMRSERPSGLRSRNSSPASTEGRYTPTSTGRKPLKKVGEIKEGARTSYTEPRKEHTLDIRVPRAKIVKAKPCFSVT